MAKNNVQSGSYLLCTQVQSNRTRQKNKRGEGNVESNDSPEIPDRAETSDIPASLRGGNGERGGGGVGWRGRRSLIIYRPVNRETSHESETKFITSQTDKQKSHSLLRSHLKFEQDS